MCIFYSRVHFAVCKGTCGEYYIWSGILTWFHMWISGAPTSIGGAICWIIFFPFFLLFMVITLPLMILLDVIQMLLWVLTLGCCCQCRPGLWARGYNPFGRLIGTETTTTYRGNNRVSTSTQNIWQPLATEWEPFADKCCCCGNSCMDYCREIKRLRAEGAALV